MPAKENLPPLHPPRNRSITDQHNEVNEATNQDTQVTTFSLSGSKGPKYPTANPKMSDDVETLAVVEIPRKKVIRSRTSYSIQFRYPQRYHYTSGRYDKYKYALYTIPQCLKQAPKYNNFPLRQSCQYDPHDSVTCVTKHKVNSNKLPHPKDSNRKGKGLKYPKEEEEEQQEEQQEEPVDDGVDDLSEPDRNGTYSFSHDDATDLQPVDASDLQPADTGDYQDSNPDDGGQNNDDDNDGEPNYDDDDFDGGDSSDAGVDSASEIEDEDEKDNEKFNDEKDDVKSDIESIAESIQ